MELVVVRRILAQVEAQQRLVQVQDARLHVVREMKTAALHRSEILPQLLELLPCRISGPSDQRCQQDHRQEAV